MKGLLALLLLVGTALVAGCSTGDDAVARGGTFEFVAPGGKTEIFYDPPSSRGMQAVVRTRPDGSVEDHLPGMTSAARWW